MAPSVPRVEIFYIGKNIWLNAIDLHCHKVALSLLKAVSLTARSGRATAVMLGYPQQPDRELVRWTLALDLGRHVA
jgi:hypothetical protein